MEVTSAYANKLIKQYFSEIQRLHVVERKRSTFKESEGVKPVVPDYDFQWTRKRINELQQKKNEVMHARNVFNATHILPNLNITIDVALVRMTQLTQEKEILDDMRIMQDRTLIDNSCSQKTEYLCANFDPADAEVEYKKVVDELTAIQLELDLCNNTVTFTIP